MKRIRYKKGGRPSPLEKIEPKLVEGKPYFGVMLGRSLFLPFGAASDFMEDPRILECLSLIRNSIPSWVDVREEKIIYRPPCYGSPLSVSSVIALKFVAYGRAHRIMRMLQGAP